MSYARFGEGDVYVYGDVSGLMRCQACELARAVGDESTFSRGDYWTAAKDEREQAREMIAHLEKHVAAGHTVPSRAFERLSAEANGEVEP